MLKITENVYVQIGVRGANVGCIATQEGVVMVESPMFPEDALKLRDEIAKIGQVRYLINTEPHHDHTTGNYYFPGIVVGHEGTRKQVLATSIDQIKEMLQAAAPNSLPLDKDFHFRPPTITFSQSLTLYLGKHTFKLINLPGHTPGETAVFIPEEKVVFTGDNVVSGTMPFLHEAVPYAWLDSLKQLQQLDVDYIVPGHGNVCGKSYLSEMFATVQAWIEAVKEALAKGQTLEEAQKSIKMYERFPGDKQRMVWAQNMSLTHLYNVLKDQK